MNFIERLTCIGCLATSALLWTPVLSAQPLQVSLNPSIELNGSRLLRNGTGIRQVGSSSVYSAGLYLNQPASTMEQTLLVPGPKRLSLVMLRDTSSDELGKLFSRGIDNNAPRSELSRLIPGLMRMSDIFSRHKRLSSGDTLFIDWVPGRGTVISVKGEMQGEPVSDPAFFAALLGIWLGNAPADPALKDALLGRTRA